MRKFLSDLWTILTGSINEMDDPHQRVLWLIGIIFIFFIIVLSLAALLTGFVENLFEIVGNTVTQTVIGEFPEVIE